MARVKLDIPRLMQFAQHEAIVGITKGAELIAAAARRRVHIGKRIKSVSADMKTTMFVVRTKRGRKLKTPKIVTVKKRANDWERRFPGQLRKSVRVVALHNSSDTRENVLANRRVYMGHYFAYYARWYERGTIRSKAFEPLKDALKENRTGARRFIADAMKTACARSNRLEA